MNQTGSSFSVGMVVRFKDQVPDAHHNRELLVRMKEYFAGSRMVVTSVMDAPEAGVYDAKHSQWLGINGGVAHISGYWLVPEA